MGVRYKLRGPKSSANLVRLALAGGLLVLALACAFSTSSQQSTTTPPTVSHAASTTMMPVETAAPTLTLVPATTTVHATPTLTAPPTTQTATSTPAPVASQATVQPFDLKALRALMLDLINADRATEGLAPVAWDELATQVAQDHAEAMAAQDYMSHWNLDGQGPDVRYSYAGGTEVVQENVYLFWYRYDDGRPAPIEDWDTVVREAQTALMESPGHRANIMNPAHTHVGVGIAYNGEIGEVRIAQEFINRYVTLEPVDRSVTMGTTLMVRGRLLEGASEPLVNLAYEPFPTPMTVEAVEAVRTYASPAEIFDALNADVGEDGTFSAEVTLDNEGRAGLYHIRIWVTVDGIETEFGAVPAVDIVVEVND